MICIASPYSLAEDEPDQTVTIIGQRDCSNKVSDACGWGDLESGLGGVPGGSFIGGGFSGGPTPPKPPKPPSKKPKQKDKKSWEVSADCNSDIDYNTLFEVRAAAAVGYYSATREWYNRGDELKVVWKDGSSDTFIYTQPYWSDMGFLAEKPLTKHTEANPAYQCGGD